MLRLLRRFSRLQLQLLLVLVALLVALRLALPWIVQSYVNRTLDEMPEYDGRIGDVDIHLWRGAYSIQNVDIVKTDGDVPVPFFAARDVDFSVEWQSLFQGALVAEIVFKRPVINFVAGPSEAQSQVGVDKPWLDVIKKLFPLNINRFEVRDGAVHYRDFHSRPRIDLSVDQLRVIATNLTNSRKVAKSLVGHIDVTGRVFQESHLDLKVRLDPSTDRPTFDLSGKIAPVSLTRLNDFSRAYAGFDFERGTLTLTTELAADNGRVKGYVKPLLDNFAVVDLREDAKNPLQLVWESVVAGVTRLFRNLPKDRFATVIPISGTFEEMKVGVLPTLGNMLKNGFIRAYDRDFEGGVEPDAAKRDRGEQ